VKVLADWSNWAGLKDARCSVNSPGSCSSFCRVCRQSPAEQLGCQLPSTMVSVAISILAFTQGSDRLVLFLSLYY